MTMMLCFAFLVAATSLTPLLLFRGDLRVRFAVLDGALSATLLGLWLLLPRLAIDIPADVAIAAFVVAKLVMVGVLLAASHASEELVWAPWRAAVVAGAVYLALVPFVVARAPIDGDEPFYLLVTESIVLDRDLDLANQYASLERSATRRTDLVPQLGDPVGTAGERYSRHEPFLSLLLVPGYLLGGLHGAVATIALLAALGVASMLLLLEEEGYSRRSILVVFPLLAFGPPLLAYATRLWPEAPAALLFSEALRAARRGHRARAGLAVVLLALLKVRFGVISAALVAVWMLVHRESRKKALVVLALLAIPTLAIAGLYPRILAVRMFDPEDVFTVSNYMRGLVGLIVDGQAGLLFQAPLWLLGLVVIFRWRALGAGARLGILSAVPYLLLLFPRAEWHGGWAPPLRYLVVFVPLFALLAAAAVERALSRGAIIAASLWSAGLTLHALAFPASLFQVAGGESVLGRWLSFAWSVDVSRLVPSMIRPNMAAVAAFVVVGVLAAWMLEAKKDPEAERPASALVAAAMALILLAGFSAVHKPGSRVELEDAHVRHAGGALFPEIWTVARFRFQGGWRFDEGASASFLYAGGKSTLWYSTAEPATMEIGGRVVELGATGGSFVPVVVELPRAPGRYTLRCLKGEPVVDLIAAE